MRHAIPDLSSWHLTVLATLLLIVLAVPAARAEPESDVEAGAGYAGMRLSAGFARWTPDTFRPPQIDGDTVPARTVELDPVALPDLAVRGEADGTAKKQGPSWIDALALGRGKRLEWTRAEKALMWSYVSLSAVDTYQTMNIPAGGVEANPVITAFAGEHPGDVETVLFKAATTYGTLKLADLVRNHNGRRWVLIAVTALQAAVVVHNEQVTGGIVF